MIRKKYCDLCDGSGHVPNCKCGGGVEFVLGCCKKCGGEGFLPDDGEVKRCCGTCASYGAPGFALSHCYRIPARYPTMRSEACCEHWIENYNLKTSEK